MFTENVPTEKYDFLDLHNVHLLLPSPNRSQM